MKLSTFDAIKTAEAKGTIEITGDLLKRCQEEELKIADDVAFVCEKYGLNYTLGGGSALGAVRHKGMIPWDDDMDINLFRTDCEAFIKGFEKEFGDRYWIHTPEKSKNYGLLFIQLRKKGTVMRGREDLDSEECGIGIDIFPMENTYNSKVARTLHGILCLGMKFGLSCRKTWRDRERLKEMFRNDPDTLKSIRVKMVLGFLTALFSVDSWTHGTIRCCKMCKNSETRYIVIPSGRKNFFGEIYERDLYQQTQKVPFEGREYRLTKAADIYLTKLYGNYMEIPPEEKREHHIVYELKFEEK